MDDRTLTLALRLIHILGGIFWVGSVAFVAWFLVPAVVAAGKDGGRIMQELVERRRMSAFMGIAALLTVLSGLILYGRLASATHGSWAGTAPGIAFGIGGVAAILGGIVGMALAGGAARRLTALGQATAGAGVPPPELQAEMRQLQTRMTMTARIASGLLGFAAAAMAVAGYL